MLRRLLKACPRCRGTHLIELKDADNHAVRCVMCGYLLQDDEIRLLNEVLVRAAIPVSTAVPPKETPR